jgi:predicted transcriptional regulator
MSSIQFQPASEEDRVDRRSEMARALARGGMEDVQVLSLETAQEVLTPKRYEIVDLLSREDVDSVRALARRLDRDKAQVSRDLQALAEHSIVTYDTDGRSKSPRLVQEHIVVEPLI